MSSPVELNRPPDSPSRDMVGRTNESIEAYLFGVAKYKILSFMRSDRVRKKYAAEFTLFVSTRYDNSLEEVTNLNDLQNTINEKIAELPPKCQRYFA